MTTETAAEPDAEQPALSLADEMTQVSQLQVLEIEVGKYVSDRRKALFERMREAQQHVPTKQFTTNFTDEAGITYTIPEPKGKVIVSDQEALVDWVMEHHPSEVKTKFEVQEAFQKSLLKTVVGSVAGVFDKDGNEVPGLKFVPPGEPTNFTTSWKGEGKQHALNEVVAALAGPGIGQLLGIEAGGDQ